MTSKNYWIWYPGDFELYHALKQNFSRVERGYGWPAFWKSEGFRNRIVFKRTYELTEPAEFTVYASGDAVGYVLAGEKKYPFGTRIACEAGEVSVTVHVGCIEMFPSVYIEGDVICSDPKWSVGDYNSEPVSVGYSRYFTDKTQNPSKWDYSEKIYMPVKAEEYGNGVLYEFETELTAVLEVEYKTDYRTLTICCGESREEALDPEHCYYSWQPERESGRCPRCAVRFAYIPDCRLEDVGLKAIHQYVDIPVRAGFSSDDPLLNQIWSVSGHTFMLCSGIFFIDGIKRDKWIWGGDAYQSFFVNQYLMADADINRRTLLALRGNDPMTTHINTIVDYSLFWILGIKAHFEAYGDREFLEQVYSKMCSLMEFCASQIDEHGFITGREGDWVFIDWADMDKEGALCAEQMLFAQCYKAMAELSGVLGKSGNEYVKKYEMLQKNINAFYWNDSIGAYIDSYSSGKNHVSRHGNIFAIIFDIADEEQTKSIVENVLHNDNVPQITTPYFKFYEMDALCRMGYHEEVMERIREYWGGMLKKGAVTFWEEYDPNVSEEEQYNMYGDKFGKSLCHAWSSSPIYLLAKYFVGLTVTDPVKGKYEVHPHLDGIGSLDCTLPVGNKDIHIVWDGKEITIDERPAHQ